LVPEIYNAISLLGGLCSVAVVISFPGLIYYQLSKKTDWKLIVITFFSIFLTLCGWASVVVSILDTFGVIKLNA